MRNEVPQYYLLLVHEIQFGYSCPVAVTSESRPRRQRRNERLGRGTFCPWRRASWARSMTKHFGYSRHISPKFRCEHCTARAVAASSRFPRNTARIVHVSPTFRRCCRPRSQAAPRARSLPTPPLPRRLSHLPPPAQSPPPRM